MIKKLSSTNKDFESELSLLVSWESVSSDEVAKTVSKIIKDVKNNGDKSLLELT